MESWNTLPRETILNEPKISEFSGWLDTKVQTAYDRVWDITMGSSQAAESSSQAARKQLAGCSKVARRLLESATQRLRSAARETPL